MSAENTPSNSAEPLKHAPEDAVNDYAEFEIGHHPVPWFLWVFFILIISWASISWVKFFGY